MGMNLGIRDAIGLGAAIATHTKLTENVKPSLWATNDVDKPLREYTSERYARALSTIKLTKKLLFVLSRVRSKRFVHLRNTIIRFIGSLPMVRRAIAWRISGMAFK
jgi:2-polyprenyl-6-methoxyphenol hydroxylase-like FAD-dependent oxidoreductase